MVQLEERADAMLRSPLGCAFLLAAEASGFSVQEIASPRNSLFLCAYASRDIEVWQGPDYYPRIRSEVLRQGQGRRDLALAILEQPAAARWFGPLEPDSQVHVPRERKAPGPAGLVPPTSPLSSWERYAEKPKDSTFTSTFVDGTAAIFVGLDLMVGDLDVGDSQKPHYSSWLVKADLVARVYEVDGPQAWHNLCVRYPAAGRKDKQTPDFSGDEDRLVPDWLAVAMDWDAVHLTFGGLLTAEQVRVESAAGWTYFWSWNIEQTLWLRWVFTEVERMPDHVPDRSPREGFFLPEFRFRTRLF